MTSLSRINVKCNCGTVNTVVYYSSICTWMSDEDWINSLLDGKLNSSTCKNCGKTIRIDSEILINSMKGFFSIKPRDDPETLRNILKNYGLINEDGTPVDEIFERLNSLSGKPIKKHPHPPPPDKR